MAPTRRQSLRSALCLSALLAPPFLLACQPEPARSVPDAATELDALESDASDTPRDVEDVAELDVNTDDVTNDDDVDEVERDSTGRDIEQDAGNDDVDATETDAELDDADGDTNATDDAGSDTDAADAEHTLDAHDAGLADADQPDTTDARDSEHDSHDGEADGDDGEADGDDGEADSDDGDAGTDAGDPTEMGSLGGACYVNATCNRPLVCDVDVCVQPDEIGTCDDNRRNGAETDVDCGGDCPACPDTFACDVHEDCVSGVCAHSMCRLASCGDGLQNGRETDVDCGAWCGPCGDGESCEQPNDCASGICDGGSCAIGRCGDGVANGDEDCDDLNSTDEDGCRADCTAVVCGDARRDWNEDCDDGDSNSDSAPNACRTTCTLPTCGDGVADDGEACDDGNEIDEDGCRTNCRLPACGDGVVDPGEQCDDANEVESDRCSSMCVLARCGDGVVQTDVARTLIGEDFDDGIVPVDLRADGWAVVGEREGFALHSATVLDLESTSAELVFSASHAVEVDFDLRVSSELNFDFARFRIDGAVVGEWSGEQAWTSFAYPLPPGEYVLEWAYEKDESLSAGEDGLWLDNLLITVDDLNERCDNGAENSDSVADACRTTCEAPRCGDRVIDTGETCDDGNNDPDDGCNPICGGVGCGDGIVQGVEQCDDANTNDFDRCTSACRRPACGDGIQQQLLPSLDLFFYTFVEVPNDWDLAGWEVVPRWLLPSQLSTLDVADGEAATARWLGTLPTDGRVEFDFTVSSEPGADLLEFYVDDDRVASWSGEQSGRVSFDLAPGGHELTWRYVKDESGSEGDDNASISTVRVVTNDGQFEECDDANDDETDRCQANCEASRCGDGILHEIPPSLELNYLLFSVPSDFDSNGWEARAGGFFPFGLVARGLADAESAELTWTGSLPAAGLVDFQFSVDSEADADFFEFYIDGTREAAWSGLVPSNRIEFALEAGERTLMWRYVKNAVGSSGDDEALITSLTIATSDGLLEECDEGDANSDSPGATCDLDCRIVE